MNSNNRDGKNGLASSGDSERSRTSGVAKVTGKTNGIVDRKGRTNGAAGTVGKTNGAVRGVGTKRWRLRSDFRTRLGVTNGLTNGKGLTNGLGAKKFRTDAKKYRRRIFLAPAIAALLLMVPLLVPSDMFRPPSTFAADGSFAEWTSTVALTRNVSLDTSIDLIRAGMVSQGDRIGFFVEVSGTIFYGDPSALNSDMFQIFIDRDSNSSTGYFVEGIGAEYLVEVVGLSHTVTRATMYKWSRGPTGDEMDWSNWVIWRTPSVALGQGLDSGKMEVVVDSLGVKPDDARSISRGRAIFRAQNWRFEEDYSDFSISTSLPSLEVVQTSVAPAIAPLGNVGLLELRVRTADGTVSIQGLKVRVLGSAISGDVTGLRVLDASDNLIGSQAYVGGPGLIPFKSSLLVGPQWTKMRVEATIARTVTRTVGLRLVNADSILAPGAAVSLSDGPSVRERSYMGLVAPGFVVDGAYSEWPGARIDAIGEQQTGGDHSIDIARYDSHKEGTHLFFYASVNYRILRGTTAPIILPSSSQASPVKDSDRDTVPDDYEAQFNDMLPRDFNNDNVTDATTVLDVDGDGLTDFPYGSDVWLNTTIPLWYGAPYSGRHVSIYIGPVVKPPPAIGEDTLRIFLDQEEVPNSGYPLGGVRADYLVEITGKNGVVIRQRCMRYTGISPGEWSWTEEGRPSIAFGGSEIEAEADFANLSAVGDVTTVFDFSDWRGGFDIAQSRSRGTRGVSAGGRTMGVADEVDTYVDEAGNIQAADLGLESIGGKYAYAAEKNGVAAYFGGRSDGRGLMLLRRGDMAFSWRPTSLDSVIDERLMESISANDVGAAASGSRLAYRDMFPGADDVYEVRLNMVKHDMTFEAAPPFTDTRGFLSVSGEVRLSEGSAFAIDGLQKSGSFATSGDLQVVSPGGVVLTIKAPFAYESGDAESRADGRIVVEKAGEDWRLSMQVPMAWFKDPSRTYPVVLDPTAIIDTYTLYTPTSLHHQRKVLYDGSNFWAFYFDGSTTQYEHSSDGMSWIDSKNAAFESFGVRNASVWYHTDGSGKVVYVVGDDGTAGTQVYAVKGTISGTSITWGTESLVTVSSQAVAGIPAFVSRDRGGRLWIVALTNEGSGQYNLVAVNSTSPDDVSAWNAPAKLLASDISSSRIFSTILPLTAGKMYALWYADGAIAGRLHSSGVGWGGVEDIATATSSVEYATPTATADDSGKVDVVYVAANGSVVYRQRTSSWGSPSVLDGNAGNQYATISRDNSTGDLYAFWKSPSAQIKASRNSGGSWTPVALEHDTMSKSYVTSVYNVSGSSRISWAWSEASSIQPMDMRFSMMGTNVKSVTVDTGAGLNSTRNSNQRKLFWDGSYYWAFYVSGGYPVYTYSPDGDTWTYGYNRLFNTSRSVSPSVWFYSSGPTKIVYAVADDDVDDKAVMVKRGVIQGATIAWGPEYNVTVSASDMRAKVAYICRDSSGYIWIGSSEKEVNYNFAVVRSSGTDDVSAWGSYAPMLSSDVASITVYGVVVPLPSGGVYALWFADGTLAGRLNSGTWGSEESINTTTAGSSKVGPSVVVDSSDNINLLFSNETGRIIYRQRTSSWSLTSVVTSTTGNDYPSLTLDTSTGELYAFWINSSKQIAAKRLSGGSWYWVSGIDVSVTTKDFITTPYNAPDSNKVSWMWRHEQSTDEVKFARIPEFADVLTPILAALLVCLVLRRRRLRRAG